MLGLISTLVRFEWVLGVGRLSSGIVARRIAIFLARAYLIYIIK